MTPAELVALAERYAPAKVAVGAAYSMSLGLLPVSLAAGEQDETKLRGFLELFGEAHAWPAEVHGFIVGHPGLQADSFWLFMTARDYLARQAESFADLPAWQQQGFTLFLRSYAVLWETVRAALDQRAEALRAEAEAGIPPRRVPLSDTIFERHGHISELIDGLKLNR